jgi:hypothetical protein
VSSTPRANVQAFDLHDRVGQQAPAAVPRKFIVGIDDDEQPAWGDEFGGVGGVRMVREPVTGDLFVIEGVSERAGVLVGVGARDQNGGHGGSLAGCQREARA